MTELVGNDYGTTIKWTGCAIGSDGCIYAFPSFASDCTILKIDPTNDSTTLVHTDFGRKWWGCISGHDGCIYGVKYCGHQILKFDPSIQEVIVAVGEDDLEDLYYDDTVAVGPDGILYFFPDGGEKIIQFDPVNKTTS